MVVAKYRLYPSPAWTSQHPPPSLNGRPMCGRKTVNANSTLGYLESDEGYEIQRLIAAVTSKGCASFCHVDSVDGSEWVWFYANQDLYKNDGATPTALTSGAFTAGFEFAHYNMPTPCGFSGFFNGTNSEAHLVRLNSGGTDIVAVAHDMAEPTLGTVTTATTGGSIADGTYQVRACRIDKDGQVNVFTAPSAVQEITTTGGGASTITIPEPTSSESRSTHWRYALTADGGSDTPSAYVLWVDAAVGSGSIVLTALPADAGSQAFADENGIYRQATLPITGVDSCWLHDGRLFVGASGTNNIAWSQRDNTNHWYSDQVLDTGAESSLSGPVIGGCSVGGANYVFTPSSIHVVFGDLTRDRDGANATYEIRVKQQPVHASLGAVSHGSIVPYGGGAFFFSNQGPAILAGGRVDLLSSEHIRPFLRRELDWTYAGRIYGAIDPDLHAACWIIPRKVNATRAFDGASVAGICDYMLRWDLRHGHWMPPRYQTDLVHLVARKHPSSQGGTSTKTFLIGTSPQGHVTRFNNGATSGGGGTTAATDAANDGQATTTANTTSAVYVEAGVSADDYNGMSVTLTYPSDDTNYPGPVAQKTIVDTTVSGSNVTITWLGALTVPSGGGAWTVRIAGLLQPFDNDHDPHDYIQIPPGGKVQIKRTEMVLRDVVGQDAIA